MLRVPNKDTSLSQCCVYRVMRGVACDANSCARTRSSVTPLLQCYAFPLDGFLGPPQTLPPVSTRTPATGPVTPRGGPRRVLVFNSTNYYLCLFNTTTCSRNPSPTGKGLEACA